MPGKKEQIALQKEITNQEQWEDLMTTEGVIGKNVFCKLFHYLNYAIQTHPLLTESLLQ